MVVVTMTCCLNLPAFLRSHNIGSLLHGVIMEQLSTESAEKLHLYRYNPIKQRLIFSGSQIIWEIICLENDLGMELKSIFNKQKNIHIKKYNASIDMSDKNMQEISYDCFVRQHMTNTDPKSFMKLDFLSPTSFKSAGSYDIFPDIKKILRSIMLNFDYFSPVTKIYDYDALENFTEHIKIIDYNLKSMRFHLERIKIPSFKGRINVKLRGNLQLLQILNLIFAFGELSGVGIKTAMGMGNMKILKTDS